MKDLEDLHSLIARKLTDMVKGEECNAAVLNVARQFLKDNNITNALKHDPDLQALTEAVPFTNTDEYGLPN